MGDVWTEEGRKFLASRSPLTYVDRTVRPLLIGQGGNDVRVTAAESEQIVAAMQKRNIPVTYVFYKDEGHGFRRAANRRSWSAVVEAFLAQHLGGRVEPVAEDFAGSTIDSAPAATSPRDWAEDHSLTAGSTTRVKMPNGIVACSGPP